VSTTAKETAPASPDYRLPANSPWAGAWKIAAGVGVVGLAIAAYGYRTDPERFPFSYLFAYFVALTMPLGCLFFVLVQYVTKAAWGVTSRRVAELFMRPMGLVFPILVIPLVLTMPQLFPWMGAKHEAPTVKDVAAEHAAPAGHDAKAGHETKSGAESKSPPESPLEQARGFESHEPAGMREQPVSNVRRMEQAEEGAEKKIVDHKRFFLNKGFVIGRLIAFLLIWSWLADRYFRWSTEQDTRTSPTSCRGTTRAGTTTAAPGRT
jgi:hypothetical protein